MRSFKVFLLPSSINRFQQFNVKHIKKFRNWKWKPFFSWLSFLLSYVPKTILCTIPHNELREIVLLNAFVWLSAGEFFFLFSVLLRSNIIICVQKLCRVTKDSKGHYWCLWWCLWWCCWSSASIQKNGPVNLYSLLLLLLSPVRFIFFYFIHGRIKYYEIRIR